MKIKDLFDNYDLKARWCPALIVLLPALVAVYGAFPAATRSPVMALFSGGMSVACLYFFSMLVRELGVAAQLELWRNWGGPPSTRFMRWRDRRFSADQKTQLQGKVLREFHLKLSNAEMERANTQAADHAIDQAFKHVREFLRYKHRAGLVDKHNAEYGFWRNLYGSRWVFTFLGLIGTFASGYSSGHIWGLTSTAVLDLFMTLAWIPLGFSLLPNIVKQNADNYAEKAWLSFLEIGEEEKE